MKSAIGYVNYAPRKLLKDSDTIFPENMIFFNSKAASRCSSKSFLENLDGDADSNFALNVSVTDSFMEPFSHEFAHVLHSYNLTQKLGTKRYDVLIKNLNKDAQDEFMLKHNVILDEICIYAKFNFVEAVACDLAGRFSKNLDSKTLLVHDFFPNSPYAKFF